MTRVVVVGCGVIGAAIAYELSLMEGLQITVLDRQAPASASTGAALGVLMGAISQKTKGRAWQLREASLRRYQTLIPELETALGRTIPVNRDGIVLLQFADDDHSKWERLIELRRSQGWELHMWDRGELRDRCPDVGDLLCDRPITGAIYSPQDMQVDPVQLTRALVEAAQGNGVAFHFDTQVHGLESTSTAEGLQICDQVAVQRMPARSPADLGTIEARDQGEPVANPDRGSPDAPSTALLPADWVVIAAGLGASPLTQQAIQPLDVRPVLGQAMRIRLERPLGNPEFQPVISGADIHRVPLDGADYWVGATVEFPDESGAIAPDPAHLDPVFQGAIALWPGLAQAKILQTWSGLRPRPWNRPAPVIEPLAGYGNVILATGHYRNGVLLAPATAQRVREMLTPTR